MIQHRGPEIATIDRRQVWWLLATAATVLGLLTAAFLPPFVDPKAGALIMSGFSKVCHQLPSRSFHIGGVQVALCHRCVGIYAAIPLAIAMFGFLRRWDQVLDRHPLRWIGASLVPLALDWGCDFVGIWVNTPTSRLVTGSVFGVVAGYFLARGVANAARPDPDAAAPAPAPIAINSAGD